MSSATQPLHENLYGAVRKYGASFQDMKVENIATGNVTVTYEIPSLSITVRVRADMLDISCANLFAISEEQAYQLITDCWNALKAADNSIDLIQHIVTASINFNLTRETQSKVFEPIVNFPKDHRLM